MTSKSQALHELREVEFTLAARIQEREEVHGLLLLQPEHQELVADRGVFEGLLELSEAHYTTAVFVDLTKHPRLDST